MMHKGPNFDRVLMRAKDFLIIGTALIAIIKWFYLNPVRMQDNLDRIEKRLQSIERSVRRRPPQENNEE